MAKPPLIICIVVIAIALLAGRQFFKQRSETETNDAAPVQAQQAVIISKRDYPMPDRRTRQREVIAGETLGYEVTFRRLPVGEDFTVKVPANQYDSLIPGTTGTLQMQGTRFIRFTAEARKATGD